MEAAWTILVVWEIDDPAKKDDERYWWSAEDVERLRKLKPDVPDWSGKPRGTSLANLRKRAIDGSVEFLHPADTRPVSISLEHWQDADPDRTYFIVAHGRETTSEEREASRGAPKPWPQEVENLRERWLAAEKAGEPELAARERDAFRAELHKRGFRPPVWQKSQAVEIESGIFVQDERPSRATRRAASPRPRRATLPRPP